MAILPTLNFQNNLKIAQVANALYATVVGKTTNDVVLADIAAAGSFNATVNAYYTYTFAGTSAADVAATVVTNLGITGANATTAKTYFTGLINAAPGAEGAAIASGLKTFSSLTADATWGAAATAWNATIANAQAYTASGAAADVTTATASGLTLTYSLTAAVDNMTGTTGNDTFNAYILNNTNTLQSGDVLNGGAATADTLNADIGNSQAFAITPHTSNIENVNIRAQSTVSDATNGNNMNANTVQIDAQRMAGVTKWASVDSRSDVIIEDVRIADSQITKDITIEFKQSDPGNVDMGVYFNQLSLRNAATSVSSSSLNLYLMDMATNNPASGATYDASNPLKDQAFGGFTFYFSAGGAAPVKVALAHADIDAATTYAQLKAAFDKAIAANPVVAGQVSTSLSAAAPISIVTDPAGKTIDFQGLTGQVLTLTAATNVAITAPMDNALGTSGWKYSSIDAPASGTIAQAYSVGNLNTTSVALVTSTVILDDVGMGSTGGDLVIGGMSVGETSTSRGVERFEITVKDNSKLQTINSTDNALREVTIVNSTDATSADVSNVTDAYSYTSPLPGNLTVNGKVGTDATLAGVETGSALATHDFAGFTDVRLIDASAMTGKLAFTAQITTDSIAKYATLVDTASSPTADVASADNTTVPLSNNFNISGANFIYTGGVNNDTMVVTVDAGVAQSRSNNVSGQSDFTFAVSGGTGNDAITLNLANPSNALLGGAEAWYTNQKLNANITINGGAGDDTIRTPGAGDAKINGDGGNDVIYTDNTGSSVQSFVGATAALSDARWVFNTANQVAALSAARNSADLLSSTNSSYALYGTTVTVTFKHLTATATVQNTAYKSTDLEINQAIKAAINNDSILSKLLIAQDGPANTLVVTALTDGARVVGDLSVALTAPAASTLNAGIVTAFNTANSTTYADGAALNVGLTATLATLTATNDYNSAFANDAVANLTGRNSLSSSDNTITPGADNDLIVLGTTLGASMLASSNETVVYATGFGNDTIVNFDATTIPGYSVTTGWTGTTHEKVQLTFSASDGTPAAETIVFENITINLSAPSTQGVIPAKDVASQFLAQYANNSAASWTAVTGGDGIVNMVRKTPGVLLTNLASTDFAGTYSTAAATGGGGVITVATTTEGVDVTTAGAAATTSKFTVTFDAATTAAVAGGNFTLPTGGSVAYAQGDGSFTLATKLAAAAFTGWTVTGVSGVAGSTSHSVTFTATAAGVNAIPADTIFGVDAASANDGISGSLTTVVTGVAATAATTAAPTAITATVAAGPDYGYDVLNFTNLGGTGIGGSGAAFGTVLTTDKSITVANLATATNSTAALVGALYNANNVAAQTHVYVAVDTATNIGTVYSVVDSIGASNAVATNQGTIDLADTLWSTLTAVNFTGGAATAVAGPSVAPAAYVVPAYAVAVPPGAITVSVAGAAAVAEGANATFTATLSGAAAGTTTVNYTLTATGGAVLGTDTGVNVPAGNTGTLTFAPGVTVQTVVVPFTPDAVTPEAGESVTLTLSAPVGLTLVTAAATTTITDVPAAVPGNVPVAAAGTTNANLPVGNYSFNIAAVASTYTYTISNFGAGDVLNFAATAALPSIVPDTDDTDGIQSYTLNDPAGIVTITLTGLTPTQDAGLFNQPSFNTVFGAGSMV